MLGFMLVAVLIAVRSLFPACDRSLNLGIPVPNHDLWLIMFSVQIVFSSISHGHIGITIYLRTRTGLNTRDGGE
jgi:hypothetical protein